MAHQPRRIATPHQIYAVASIVSSYVEHCSAIADADRNRWFNAVAKATAQLLDGVRFEQDEEGIIFPSRTRTGLAHHVNGTCDCEAAEDGQPCWHRAAARMIRIIANAQQHGTINAPTTPPQRISAAQARHDIDELFS